jgi:hypothetical protein
MALNSLCIVEVSVDFMCSFPFVFDYHFFCKNWPTLRSHMCFLAVFWDVLAFFSGLLGSREAMITGVWLGLTREIPTHPDSEYESKRVQNFKKLHTFFFNSKWLGNLKYDKKWHFLCGKNVKSAKFAVLTPNFDWSIFGQSDFSKSPPKETVKWQGSRGGLIYFHIFPIWPYNQACWCKKQKWIWI